MVYSNVWEIIQNMDTKFLSGCFDAGLQTASSLICYVNNGRQATENLDGVGPVNNRPSID